MKGLAHEPVCVRTSLGERNTSTTSSARNRFRGRPVVFPLRRVGAKNRCYRVLDTGVSRARYFNPGTGRFWTADEDGHGHQEDPQSLHLYTYCEGDPVNNTDPSGHDIGGFDIGSVIDSALDSFGFHFSTAQFLTPIASELDDKATQILWAETGSLYPGLKQGSKVSKFENWDSGSRASLNKARERIVEIINEGKFKVAEPKPLPDVSGKHPIVWEKAQVDDVRAARKAAGNRTSMEKVFMWPSDNSGKTPTSSPKWTLASWPYDYTPRDSYGPFRVLATKSGDPVPVSDKVYLFFYINVP